MAERVQKLLSQWGIASRRSAEQMIVEQRVRVNGRIIQLGD
ncbi:MAG: S4 domain-containing protein, partial [Microcystaceae cyanobacterium]